MRAAATPRFQETGSFSKTTERAAPANGVFGYFAGPRLHIVDIAGLGDPLLSRLPALTPWRIGHFLRAIPIGYADPETVDTQLVGPQMRAYYQRLSLITKGPLA